ncbi:VOC family protein [Eubacteriaceae bacterium ES2]|nr:VOC family protein [Eubacteriaceae bacterium ES2]
MSLPVSFNHLGISVADIDKAVEFYREVFGWKPLFDPMQVKRMPPMTDFTDTIYGDDWGSFRMCSMATENGIDVELLEFEGNYSPKSSLEYRRLGVFHFGIATTDAKALLSKIEEHGGKQYSDYSTRQLAEGKRDIVFIEDPFGNVIEIFGVNND